MAAARVERPLPHRPLPPSTPRSAQPGIWRHHQAFDNLYSRVSSRSGSNSAQRFRGLAERAGADVILSNHGKYDDTPRKLDAVERRAPGASHPYVVGKESVGRFFTVAEHCALAGVG
jgi:hypothetical protein